MCLLVLVLLLNSNAHSNMMGVTTTPTNYITFLPIMLRIMLGKKLPIMPEAVPAYLLAASLHMEKARHAFQSSRRETRSRTRGRTNISQALIISGTTNSGPLSCE